MVMSCSECLAVVDRVLAATCNYRLLRYVVCLFCLFFFFFANLIYSTLPSRSQLLRKLVNCSSLSDVCMVNFVQLCDLLMLTLLLESLKFNSTAVTNISRVFLLE